MINVKVLLVSDDAVTGHLWAHGLTQKGLEVIVVDSATAAIECWSKETFNLAIIDVYTPHLDGLELCRRLRAQATNPILLLTYSSTEPHMLEAYQVGVDECIAKPLSPPLFLAKVMAWLRQSWTVPAEALDGVQVADLRLDPAGRVLLLPNQTVIKLTNLEFRLLHLLMSHPGQVLTVDTIVRRVWGYSGTGDGVLLKNVVYRLRRKIEPDPSRPRYLQTIAGDGYTFQFN